MQAKATLASSFQKQKWDKRTVPEDSQKYSCIIVRNTHLWNVAHISFCS